MVGHTGNLFSQIISLAWQLQNFSNPVQGKFFFKNLGLMEGGSKKGSFSTENWPYLKRGER